MMHSREEGDLCTGKLPTEIKNSYTNNLSTTGKQNRLKPTDVIFES